MLCLAGSTMTLSRNAPYYPSIEQQQGSVPKSLSLSITLQRTFYPFRMSEPEKLDDLGTKGVDVQTSHRSVLNADDELLAELGYKSEFKREFTVRDHVLRASDAAECQEIS